jgi:hypothetical protein
VSHGATPGSSAFARFRIAGRGFIFTVYDTLLSAVRGTSR